MSKPTGPDQPPPPAAPETVTWRSEPGEGTSELARVLDQYLADLEAGRSPDRAQLLAAHPDLAPQLEQALAGLEFVHQSTGRTSSPPAQLGDFRILREVGRGGMGVVYEAEQVSLRRRVALKVLRFGAVADEVAMHRFQREAETVARLHHTNIVPIFAVGSADGVRYYAMQFIEGRDLAERLRVARETKQAIPEREIADWGLQAAEALAHAHRRGVIHRDIKPSNLICDPEGRVWLTDFGLARRTDDAALSVTGALLGTPRYMSPEQARAAKQPVDHRTDLYSLGATLYELATRRPIFEAATAHEVIAQILHAEPPSPRALAPNLARDLETIILKCLAKEPAERYATAQALAEDLRSFLAGRPIAARPPNLPERVVRWARKHRRTTAVAALSAGAAVVLVGGGLLAWQQYQRARLGGLAVSTSGPNLLAEVLDPAGQPVSPVFPLPTASPISLPAGAYHLRLSAAGMLSETWPIDLEPRQLEQHSLQLRPRWLWPPKEVNLAEFPQTEIVELGVGADLLVLTHATKRLGVQRHENSIQLLRGATGDPAWKRPLAFDDSTVPAGGNPDEWKRLFVSGIASSFQDSGLAERAHDLDGDGTRDLVLLSRNSPSLLAVSGRTGAVLWWYRMRPPLPDHVGNGPAQFEHAGGGCVVGMPAVADTDRDDAPDYIACFWSEGATYLTPANEPRRAEPQGWIGAVSGRTGVARWLQPVNARWDQYANSSSERDKLNALCRPALGPAGARSVVVLVEGTRLLGWDVATGSPAWPPLELGYPPTHAPDVADLDGDGASEALLVRPPDGGPDAELRALTLPEGTVRWKHPIPVLAPHQIRHRSRLERVVMPPDDLDGDGRPEIVVLTASRTRSVIHELGVELLEATGQRRWAQRLGVSRFLGQGGTVQRILPGPDLDGDGHRELFPVWHADDFEPAKRGLVVAALSGRTGGALWRVVLPGTSEARTLAWWQAGNDGWPQLLVGVDHAGGGQRMTYLLAGGSGRTEHVLPDVAEPRVADFDGDGIADLFYTVSPQGAPRQLVIKGLPPEPWRRPGAWQGAQDFDGDGETDLIGTEARRLTARSGGDGRRLWQNQLELQDSEPLLVPRSPAHDLNGDGTPDLVFAVNTWRRADDGARSSYRTLAACSGKDGALLWTAEDWELGGTSGSSSRTGWSFEYPVLAWAEQPNGAAPDILVVHQGIGQALELVKLAGRDGRPLWSGRMMRGGLGPFPSPSGPPLADLNEDGVPDVTLWVPEAAAEHGGGPCRLTLLDGRSGSTLWASQDIAVEDDSRVIWPEAVVGDLDGDGLAEVIVTRHYGYDGQNPGYRCELIVADGRTGQVRWTWTWRSGFPDLWPPLVLPLRAGGARLCLAVREAGFDGLVVLDAAGQVRLRRPLKLTGNSLDAGRLAWRIVDVDRDGLGELLYLDDGHLCLARGEALEVHWRWQVPGDLPMVPEPHAAAAGPSATLPVWTGRDVFGLNALDATVRWRGMVSGEPRVGGSSPPELRLLASQRFRELPRLQCVWSGGAAGPEPGVVNQAWSTSASGQYLAPAPTPVVVSELSRTLLAQRPWPWADRLLVTVGFLSGATSLLLLVLPAALAHWAIQRRSWLLGFVPVAYAALSVLWLQQGAALLVALTFGGWLLVWSWQTKTKWLAALALVYVGLALLPFLAVTASHPLGDLHPWGAWWWLDELIAEPLVVALAGLPPLLFWGRTFTAARRWDWRTLGRWVSGALFAAVLLAAVVLFFDRQHKLPEETYAARGWYGIVFAGIYVAGFFGLLEVAWQQASSRLRRRRLPRAGASRPW